MNYNITLQKAIALAVTAHNEQYREDGSPYILHLLRVMFRMETVLGKIVAVLHDILEDTNILILEVIRRIGLASKEPSGQEVMGLLNRLTGRKDVKYGDYIDNISKCKLAREIKMADLQDNLNVLELREIDDYRLQRIKKYYDAYKYLEKWNG